MHISHPGIPETAGKCTMRGKSFPVEGMRQSRKQYKKDVV